MLELVLGGARSGKSAYAERRAHEFAEQQTSAGNRILYIATATAADAEMAARIRHHQASRPDDWHTIEEPIKLARVLAEQDSDTDFIIVDCLTLWLMNLQSLEQEEMQHELTAVFSVLPTLTTSLILISNEIGMGVVPMGAETRRFVDEAGRLHQRLAALCPRVTQMIAGIPHRIKDE